MASICDEIQLLERRRFFMMKQRIRMHNALGAYVRRDLGWSPDLPEKEQEEIRKRAAAMIKAVDPLFEDVITATNAGAKPFEQVEDTCSKAAGKLARKLPVWDAFGKGVLGFGEGGLAVIIGEAGDLSNYDDFPKLWKRLGLHTFDGLACATWSRPASRPRALTADEWTEAGYVPTRRSKMFAYIGEPLLKQPGRYQDMYNDRKPKEAARAGVKTKMHAHLAAHRYATKMFIKHLWQAWRAAEQTNDAMSKDHAGFVCSA